MRIQSRDRYVNVADFDPESGRLREYRRRARLRLSELTGHYANLSGTVAVLYRLDGDLWFRLGEHARCVDAPGIEVDWEHAAGRSIVELRVHGLVVASAVYWPEPGGGPDDPTPMAEPEDFDFGLFVKNVIGNDGRRARIYTAAQMSESQGWAGPCWWVRSLVRSIGGK